MVQHTIQDPIQIIGFGREKGFSGLTRTAFTKRAQTSTQATLKQRCLKLTDAIAFSKVANGQFFAFGQDSHFLRSSFSEKNPQSYAQLPTAPK